MTLPVPTVFVVDDDASVRRAMERLFTSVGLRVETFGGAEEVLSRGLADEHGCILLDLKMPKIDGLELQRQLEGLGINLPVIFLTAHADVPITVRAMKEGALEVFTKPFQPKTLLDTVQKAIGMDVTRQRERAEYQQLRQRFETLTARERTVMAYVVVGTLNKQIAGRLGTSEKTVKVHRARVMVKMAAASLPELVRMADRLGVAPDHPEVAATMVRPDAFGSSARYRSGTS